MFRLQVENFSCIAHADVVFRRLTVIIGPQASGKSVLSKLAYFFVEVLSEQHQCALEQKSFDAFKDSVKAKFADWFPVTAWGDSKFVVNFQLGAYAFKVTRGSYDASLKNTLRIHASAFVQDHHKRSIELVKQLRQSGAEGDSIAFDYQLGVHHKALSLKLLEESLGEDFVSDQVFIPAGRSFFTTLGRAFMAFDQLGALDPITVKFGRLYSTFHDHRRASAYYARSLRLDQEFASILGGKVVWEGERPFLRTVDGRLVPFSALSSGQQELVPLLVAISTIRRPAGRRNPGAHLLYIEEPEAHLFPSAQSELVQGLAAIVRDPSRRLAITTHSPYVLSKINNLIRAGQLSEKLTGTKLEQLDRVVAKRFRLQAATVSAYAIVDGKVIDIIDENGLIAADYLDQVSGDIGEEFGKLLSIEFSE